MDRSDEEWLLAIQASIQKFINQGSTAFSDEQLHNLKHGLQGYLVQAKRREHLANASRDTLTVARAILNGLGGAIDH
ncbi:MAG: hypothetical protein AB7F86_09655 [Bdellovibrionales bacterium]